jgi:hypothetical protein
MPDSVQQNFFDSTGAPRSSQVAFWRTCERSCSLARTTPLPLPDRQLRSDGCRIGPRSGSACPLRPTRCGDRSRLQPGLMWTIASRCGRSVLIDLGRRTTLVGGDVPQEHKAALRRGVRVQPRSRSDGQVGGAVSRTACRGSQCPASRSGLSGPLPTEVASRARALRCTFC